jgi:hypothetical protein
VLAPEATSDVVTPEQTVGELAMAVTVGVGCTDTEVLALPVPQALAPVTEYPEAVVGEKGTPLVTVLAPVQV